MPAPERPLSTTDVADAKRLHDRAKELEGAAVEFCLILQEIRERNLWKIHQTYKSFEEYVWHEFHIRPSSLYRKLTAAKVARSLEQTSNENSRARENTLLGSGVITTTIHSGEKRVILGDMALNELERVPEPDRQRVLKQAVMMTYRGNGSSVNVPAVKIRAAAKSEAVTMEPRLPPGMHRCGSIQEPLEPAETDQADRPVLHQQVRDALAKRARFRAVVKLIEEAKLAALTLANDESGIGRDIHAQSVEGGMDQAISYIRQAMPHASCPRWPQCKVGCKACLGTLWVSRFVWDATPEKVRNNSKPVPADGVGKIVKRSEE